MPLIDRALLLGGVEGRLVEPLFFPLARLGKTAASWDFYFQSASAVFGWPQQICMEQKRSLEVLQICPMLTAFATPRQVQIEVCCFGLDMADMGAWQARDRDFGPDQSFERITRRVTS